MPSLEEKEAVSALLRPLRNPCIVELGAHTGEDEIWMRQACCETPHYVMVEPDPRNVQAILERAPTSRVRRLIVGAIADEMGMREFHFSFNVKDKTRASGSLRKPTGHLAAIPEVSFPFDGLVQTYTLDQVFEAEWLTKIDLLWVDIQGAENLMIAGGQTALQHTRYLFMEVEVVELYEGEALKPDLISMLPGWEVLQEFQYNVLMFNPAFYERNPR